MLQGSSNGILCRLNVNNLLWYVCTMVMTAAKKPPSSSSGNAKSEKAVPGSDKGFNAKSPSNGEVPSPGKDTKNRQSNKAGKETSKQSQAQAVSSDVVAAPTASARSKTGKNHPSTSTSAPSQSSLTPFPTPAEKQTSAKAEKATPSSTDSKTAKKRPTSTSAPSQSDLTPFPTPAEKQISAKAEKATPGSTDSKTAKKFAKSIKPHPSPKPTIEVTDSPSLSPTVTWSFDSFESATFPEFPWIVSNGEDEENDEYNWALTDEDAFKGTYSIKSPTLPS